MSMATVTISADAPGRQSPLCEETTAEGEVCDP
jgi:hypothetical protein